MKQESMNSMIRGALPLAWGAVFCSTALLYGLPTNDPTWSALISELKTWNAPIPAMVLLAMLTFFMGIPTKRELLAASLVGVMASTVLVVLVAALGREHIGWFLLALFLSVIPLSKFLFKKMAQG